MKRMTKAKCRMSKWVVLLITLHSSLITSFATVYNSNGSRADVQAKIDAASDGDVVTIPSGTFTWTSNVTITKSITLTGCTTVNPSARTANDLTIIRDDVATDWTPTISIQPATGRVVRVTGITFQPGSRTAVLLGGAVNIYGPQATAVRLDNCHFFALYRTSGVFVGSPVYGVMDHCLFSYLTSNPYTQSILVRMPNWNGDTNGAGDRSFSDYPWFGTEKFFFIEDNTFDNTTGNTLMGSNRCEFWRANGDPLQPFYNVQIQNHGTEGRLSRDKSGRDLQ